MTQPGNLKCKKILHLVGQTDPVKIKKVVFEALEMCVKDTYTSVSFPAIGTGEICQPEIISEILILVSANLNSCNLCIIGQGSVHAGQVADAMMDAVIDVLSKNTSGPLKTIRIVIFQPPMLKDFYNSMDQRVKKEDSATKEKGGFWGNVGAKIKCKYRVDNSFHIYIYFSF